MKRLAALALSIWLAAVGGAAEFLSKPGDAMAQGLAAEISRQVTGFKATGRVSMLVFIDCESKRCETMAPELESYLWRPLKDHDLQLIAVAIKSSEADVENLRRSTGVTFPVISDEEGELFGLFASDGVPRAVVFDRFGRLAYQHAGFDPGREAEFRKVVDLLLEGEALPPELVDKAAAAREAATPNLYAKSIVGEQAPEVPVEVWVTTPPPSSEGKFLLVDFWATWCGPCVRSLDEAEPLHAQFADKVVMMAISDEDSGRVRAFVKSKGWTQHIGVDTQARASNELRIRSIPHAFLADPQGKVIWQGHPGEIWANDARGLKALINQPTATPAASQ